MDGPTVRNEGLTGISSRDRSSRPLGFLLSEPVQFGRYQLVALLGEGGMARVYKAVLGGQMGFKKNVALKRISRSLTKNEKIIRALINEARLGGRLHNKYIVETYEFDDVDGHWYMAMEYVDGWPMDVLLAACRENRHWMPASVAVEIFECTLRGLAYAHDLTEEDGTPLQLVHRDLKPGNVMISRSGDVKVMDFGIAKAETNLYKTTDADSTKGTPVYMSPEQVRAEKLDKRSDLFSLGSMLHELVTLQVPFQGSNLGSIVAGILQTDLTEPLARVERRCAPLVPVVAKLMAKKPEDRYPDAQAVLKHLRKLRSDLPPGPTLADWLTDIDEELPKGVTQGDFGDDGPPKEVLDPRTATGEIGAVSEPPAAEGPSTQGKKRRKKPNDLDATRAGMKRRPPPKKGVSTGTVVMIALVAAGLVGAGVVVVMNRESSRAPNTEAETPAAIVEASTSEAATPGAAPTPEPTPAPAPAAAAERPTPTREVATPRPEPATPKPAPVAAAEPGFLKANSDPWSKVTVDGKSAGNVPIKRHPLQPGDHSITFECGPCDPPQSKTVLVTIRSGQETKKIVRFD